MTPIKSIKLAFKPHLEKESSTTLITLKQDLIAKPLIQSIIAIQQTKEIHCSTILEPLKTVLACNQLDFDPSRLNLLTIPQKILQTLAPYNAWVEVDLSQQAPYCTIWWDHAASHDIPEKSRDAIWHTLETIKLPQEFPLAMFDPFNL